MLSPAEHKARHVPIHVQSIAPAGKNQHETHHLRKDFRKPHRGKLIKHAKLSPFLHFKYQSQYRPEDWQVIQPNHSHQGRQIAARNASVP